MSSGNHSTLASAVCNGNASSEGNMPVAWGTPFNEATDARPSFVGEGNQPAACVIPFNEAIQAGQSIAAWGRHFSEGIEAGPSVIGAGSVWFPALSDSIRMSPQCSPTGDILQRFMALSHNSDSRSNGIYENVGPPLPSQKVSLLGLPNGPKPSYNEISRENCSRGASNSRGGYGYRHDQNRNRRHERRPNSFQYTDQDIRHDWRQNSYRGLNCMIPRVQFPQGLPRPYLSLHVRPLPFIGNYHASIAPPGIYFSRPRMQSILQGPIGFSYAPIDVHYPTQPRAEFFSWPYFVPCGEIYAAQQSNFSVLLDNLSAKLRMQIEYYFSSDNLRDDFYLKKHMDEDGWVPVTLIAADSIVVVPRG